MPVNALLGRAAHLAGWQTPKTPSGGGQTTRMTEGGGLRKLEDQALSVDSGGMPSGSIVVMGNGDPSVRELARQSLDISTRSLAASESSQEMLKRFSEENKWRAERAKRTAIFVDILLKNWEKIIFALGSALALFSSLWLGIVEQINRDSLIIIVSFIVVMTGLILFGIQFRKTERG